ncbi:NUDIX hydrolase [Actinokineospora globicatena]|uniref:Uncharacterized protein n=1 Tax=Actinokineospora globicatena TaxID=103729 RepID=A0A9W6QNM3_9PSEU|nr:NUDIX hydrolase [Actinokineospora globicatena]GLW91794.1 hypothetical protein Aglo03_26100 [Actinokineospora globicatena]
MYDTTAIAHDESILGGLHAGQGYGRPYRGLDLDEIAHNLATATIDLPPRFHAPFLKTTRHGKLIVPSGYDILGHPNRDQWTVKDPDITTDPYGDPQVDQRLQDHFRSRRWRLDQHGRPLHPHYHDLLDDPRIGMPTGLGFARWYGETAVVDIVAVHQQRVVLVPRQTRDEGLIAGLPGGYAEPIDEGVTDDEWATGTRPTTREGIFTSALRKLEHESGLIPPDDSHMDIVRAIRPVSSVHTLHAWTATYTVLLVIPDDASGVDTELDEETGARWAPADPMWPDHRRALTEALIAAGKRA